MLAVLTVMAKLLSASAEPEFQLLYPTLDALNHTESPGLMKPELLLFVFNAYTPITSSKYVDSKPEISN